MKIEIIPATDILGGACVRVTLGDYGRRTTYYSDPLEAAQRFEEAGIRRLHMVDLDGAKASEPRNLAVVALIIIFGVGGMTFNIGSFRLGGIGLAAVTGVLLNLFLPRAVHVHKKVKSE